MDQKNYIRREFIELSSQLREGVGFSIGLHFFKANNPIITDEIVSAEPIIDIVFLPNSDRLINYLLIRTIFRYKSYNHFCYLTFSTEN